MRNLKRENKLRGRKICHGNTTNCLKEHAIKAKPTKYLLEPDIYDQDQETMRKVQQESLETYGFSNTGELRVIKTRSKPQKKWTLFFREFLC